MEFKWEQWTSRNLPSRLNRPGHTKTQWSKGKKTFFSGDSVPGENLNIKYKPV